ncbi:hypothetical protein ACIOKD_41175 [Streptomyces sp. NPDC087844]|uniref:hypothetical protein n=1 Tax=Streptomyces sp. NPDC087844 TaxID=3365805 RepID=UPI0037F9D0E5
MGNRMDVGLCEALVAWFRAVAAGPKDAQGSGEMVQRLGEHPLWEKVRQEVGALAPHDRRPDLYGGTILRSKGGTRRGPAKLSNRRLLGTSGLAEAARAASRGEGGFDPDEVAKEFAALVTGPALTGEDWLLMDADLPEGCSVQVGEWTLERVNPQRLAELRPTGVLGRFRRFDLDSDLLDGAAFLHRETAWRRTGTVLPWPLLHARPQVRFAVPQSVLGLWACEPVHLDAIYYRENGRQAVREFGSVPVEEQSSDGENFWESRVDGPYRVEPAELVAFMKFIAVAGELMTTAAAELTTARKPADRKPSPRAQRLARATEHLVQATHATYGGDYVRHGMLDELVTHYVIALEALLAGGDSEGLTRRVGQRAAALHLTDDIRTDAEDLVRRAYATRSIYAHGAPPPAKEKDRFPESDLLRLRQLTYRVLLRWLVLWAPDEKDRPQLHQHQLLDRSLISRQVASKKIEEPLRRFYAATPPADLPADVC